MSPLFLKEGFLNGELDKLIWEDKKHKQGTKIKEDRLQEAAASHSCSSVIGRLPRDVYKPLSSVPSTHKPRGGGSAEWGPGLWRGQKEPCSAGALT